MRCDADIKVVSLVLVVARTIIPAVAFLCMLFEAGYNALHLSRI